MRWVKARTRTQDCARALDTLVCVYAADVLYLNTDPTAGRSRLSSNTRPTSTPAFHRRCWPPSRTTT